MSTRTPRRTAGRRARATLVGALAVGATAVLGLVEHPLWAAAPTTPSITGTPPAHHTARQPARSSSRHDGVVDGAVPDGVTVFDERYPAVTRLDADLLAALRRAASDAGHDGIELDVNSGWRSPAYQEHLLQEAISTYGSPEEAARWVATPTTSAHVSGDAVDIGPARSATWLADHGATYGLCRVYRNEPWHFELRPEAADRGCPAPYADPAHDPRMQQ